MRQKFKPYHLLLLILALGSCNSSKNISGKYKSNFADLGFFITTINLNENGSFEYNFSGDLINQNLTGTYQINENKLYLKFLTNKGEIESQSDTATIAEMLAPNRHNYELKTENEIEYHLKYLIKNNKLLGYRVDNGKLVRKAKIYSDRKQFILFGSHWRMKKFYLKKQKTQH